MNHEMYLAKQPIGCQIPCCVLNCTRFCRWACLGGSLISCDLGVCLCHGKDILKGDNVVNVTHGMPGRLVRPRPVPPIVSSTSANFRVPLLESIPIPSPEVSEDENEEYEFIAPIGMEDPYDDQDRPSLHARADIIPIYDVNRSLPGHYLWNKGYGVLRRRMHVHANVQANTMMQHIVSITKSACTSLLYPEGQLFPRIFWTSQDSSVVGSIPSFMLNLFFRNTRHGLASLAEHHSIRMMDSNLLTSKQNAYWHYLFDLTLNQQLNRCSSALVFKRGLEFLLENEDTDKSNSDWHAKESQLPMDEAESTRRVKELACLLKKGSWTYFVTLTVNDAETPGIRKITEAILRYSECPGAPSLEDLTVAYLPFLLRIWFRFVSVLLQELIMRNDKIIGKVQNLFYRFEFQEAGAKGNKPHCHMGVTLEPEPKDVSCARISCMSKSFDTSMYGTDYDTLRGLGVVCDQWDYQEWRNIFGFVNTHDCNRCQQRCMKATNAFGEKICRYRKQPRSGNYNPDNWFENIELAYSEEVYGLLEEMGLASVNPDRYSNGWSLHDPLRAGKWHYDADQSEFFTSSIPLLSAITRSATNVDMCDSHFQTSYLLSYISGSDEHRLLSVSGSKNIKEVLIRTEEHAHEKIASCRKIVKEKEAKNPHLGREVSLAEVVWFVLGFQYTYCTANFVSVCTLPLDNRAAVRRQTNNHTGVSPAQARISAGFPPWRQFTISQIAHMEEHFNSAFCIDRTSGFNLRPPELLVFDDLQFYNECFVALKCRHSRLSADVAAQPFEDGAGRLVKIYSCSVSQCISFLETKPESFAAIELLQRIFLPIQSGNSPDLVKIFVQATTARVIVSVISFVKPWDRTKFLTHLCLSLGRYQTEMDLFCCGNIKQAFFIAGLLPNFPEISRQDVLNILKRYVVEDLRYHPISARQFSRYVKAAMDTLQDVLLDGAAGNYTPCMSEIMLKEQASEQLRAFEATRKSNLIRGLLDDEVLYDYLPPNLEHATMDDPLQWIPTIDPTEGISDEAISEQSKALRLCLRAIDKFMTITCRGLKFPCLVGRPGSGKSHVLKIASAYALSKGLLVEMMSFTSERSRKIGGNHLHLVFPLSVNPGRAQMSHEIFHDCLKTLEKDPLKTAVIKRTDVFFFEEIGLFSSQIFTALDSILQFLMGNSLPFGGKLLISCGDSKQLPPVTGLPVWSSVQMCTIMEIIVFKADVRARDPDLKWLNDQCRRDLTEQEASDVADVVLQSCSFVPDWKDIPDGAVRIVSTREAEKAVMDEFLANKNTTDYLAVDEVQNNTSWIEAAPYISRKLDKVCYEYLNCRLFVNAIVRMTYNERHAAVHFSQGQVAVVIQLPDDTLPINQQTLTLRLAPPGARQIDADDIPDDWPQVVVPRKTSHSIVVGRGLQMGRRTQFPIRYYLTSTIHRIQGETVDLYATQISEVYKQYRLWQKEQFAVLISRAHYCRDIIFVGDRNDTRNAIVKILGRSSKWSLLIDQYMSNLDVLSDVIVPEIDLNVHPFEPLYRELPTAPCGYMYLLVSIPHPEHTYAGETDDIKKRLREHNTGYGVEETRPTELHPWALFAFVCGFDFDNEEMDEGVTLLEYGIEARKEFLQRYFDASDWTSDAEAKYLSMRNLVEYWNTTRGGVKLVIVKCGQIRPI